MIILSKEKEIKRIRKITKFKIALLYFTDFSAADLDVLSDDRLEEEYYKLTKKIFECGIDEDIIRINDSKKCTSGPATDSVVIPSQSHTKKYTKEVADICKISKTLRIERDSIEPYYLMKTGDTFDFTVALSLLKQGYTIGRVSSSDTLTFNNVGEVFELHDNNGSIKKLISEFSTNAIIARDYILLK